MHLVLMYTCMLILDLPRSGLHTGFFLLSGGGGGTTLETPLPLFVGGGGGGGTMRQSACLPMETSEICISGLF